MIKRLSAFFLVMVLLIQCCGVVAFAAEKAEPILPTDEPVISEVETVPPEDDPETEPEVPEAKPEVLEAKPEILETEPEILEAEPEVPETEPEVPETEPEVPETEPEVLETEPEEPKGTSVSALASESTPMPQYDTLTPTTSGKWFSFDRTGDHWIRITPSRNASVYISFPQLNDNEFALYAADRTTELKFSHTKLWHPLKAEETYWLKVIVDRVYTSSQGSLLIKDDDWYYEDGVLTFFGDNDYIVPIGGSSPWTMYGDEITHLVLEEGVTRIGNYWFERAGKLTQIDLPSSLTSIGDNAFYYTQLTEIELPSGLTTIGKNAFYGSDLTKIELPSSLKSIGNSAFGSCTKLTSAKINASVIPGYAFSECASLTDVQLSEGVTKIGDYAFNKCTSLTEITFPSTLTTVGKYIVTGCSSMTSASYNGTALEWRNRVSVASENTWLLKHLKFQIRDGITPTAEEQVFGVELDSTVKEQWFCIVSPEDMEVTMEGKNTDSVCDTYAQLYDERIQTSIYSNGTGGEDEGQFKIAYTMHAGEVYWLKVTMNKAGSTGSFDLHISSSSPGWTLEDGTLTIYKDSSMEDYPSTGTTRPPWYSHAGQITRIVVAEGVTFLGEFIFMDLKQVTEIVLPQSLTRIGGGAFQVCTKLTEITIPAGVTNIGYYIAANSGLEAIYVDPANRSYRSVDGVLFTKNMSELVTYPPYKETAFYDVPHGVTSIASGSFHTSRNLVSVTLPDGVTTMGFNTFYNCTRLANITLPQSLTRVWYGAFDSCSNLSYALYRGSRDDWSRSVTVDPNNLILTSRLVFEPEVGFSLGEESRVFYTSLTISKKYVWYCIVPQLDMPVTMAGENIAGACNTYATLYDASQARVLATGGTGNGQFTLTYQMQAGRTYWLKVEMYDSGYTGNFNVRFSGKNQTSGITWGLVDGTLYISGRGSIIDFDRGTTPWFGARESINRIVVSEGVVDIGNYTFSDCPYVTQVILPNGLRSIGEGAFLYCSDLPQISLPDTLTSIGKAAFARCGSLSDVILPDSLTRLGNMAFAYCDSITEMTIPEKVTSLEGYTFFNCTALSEVTLPDKLPQIGEAEFYGCERLKKVDIPNTVTSLGIGAFALCDEMTQIVIPEGVTTIGESAFEECSGLTTVYLPKSLTDIKEAAFYNCAKLAAVHYAGTESAWKKIKIGAYNTSLSGIVHYSSGAPHDHVYETVWTYDGSSHWHSCKKCDEFADKAAHTLTWVVDKEPTERAVGYQHEECSVCGYKQNEKTEIPKLPHDHSFVNGWKWDKTIHWRICDICGEVNGTYLHDFFWVVDVEPTEEEYGYRHEECSVCGYKQSENTEIPKLPHTHKFSEEWRLDETSHWHPCSGCEEKADEAAHDFVWVVDEEPTEEDYGFQHEECTVCGYKQSENTEIPSVGWGDITEEDRAEAGFGSVEDIPQGIWLAGVPESVDYCGAAITLPDLRVYSGKQLLTSGVDYTVKYANNTKVSTEKTRAKVTVTGKGNFTGSQAVEFEILPYSIYGLEVAGLTANETGKVQKPSPVVTAEVGGKTVTLKKGTDYTVVYPGTDTKAPDYNADAFKIAGTHSIRIEGKGNYAGETVCDFTLLEKSYINISKATVGKIANAVYDGEPQEPVITLTYSKTPLEEGEDYEVTYKNNVEVGTASVIISGKGDFFGSVTKTFKITGVALSKAKIEGLAVKETYTGEQILGAENAKLYIAATKTAPQIDLVEGVDYTVTYTNNVKAGSATVTFTGKGGYTGTVKKTFTIAATNAFEVEPLEAQTYTKGSVKPLPVVKFNGKTLVNGTDYTLTYKNNTKVADLTVKSVPTVTVKGKGNFTGSVAVNFEIVPSALYNVTATATDIVYANKANLCKPTITVVDSNGSKLAAGTDYEKTIVYTYAEDTIVTQLVKKEYVTVERRAGDEVDKLDIIPARTVMNATLTGKGNYADSTLTVPFRFVQGSLAKATVKIAAQTYTGRPIRLKKSDITVKIGKDTLTAADYEIVSYKNNTAKGTAKVTLRGIGNYGGTKEVSFTISARKMT